MRTLDTRIYEPGDYTSADWRAIEAAGIDREREDERRQAATDRLAAAAYRKADARRRRKARRGDN
jgi:hypothetical protein